MELQYLKEFILMAEYEDLFETSEHLFMSQSTLSRHIKSIEDELNIQLFERTSRSMKLNSYGKLFLEYAKRMVQLDESCKKMLQIKIKEKSDVLQVASLYLAGQYYISSILKTMRNSYPDYQINVHSADSNENWEMLEGGSCDFAFVMEVTEENPKVKRIFLTSDRIVAVMPEDHILAMHQTVSVYQLAAVPLLMFDKTTYVHQLCTEIFARENLFPQIVATAFRSENLLGLAKKDMGVVLLTEKDAEACISKGLVIRPLSPAVVININVIYRKDRMLREIDSRFLAAIDYVLKNRIAL